LSRIGMTPVDIANPSEEHTMLREMVRDWTKEYVEPQALEHDKNERFNLPLMRSMGDLGLLGISAPEEYGGSGLDAVACTIVHEELSASDPGFTLAYLAHSMLFTNNLAHNGNDEQKARILPKVCSGEWIGAMAMSEPDAGTDVLGLGTSAVQREDGSWLLNGRKMWITNGCIDEDGTPADVVWVYARTGTDEKGRVQLSTFLVEAGMAGYSVGQKIYDKTGMRASNTAELVFDDCIIPAANLVGEVGESLIHMMGNLEIERLTLAAMALGIARRSMEEMNRYATDRIAFGSKIRDFGQVQRHIGEGWAKYRAMRAYIYDTANNLSWADTAMLVNTMWNVSGGMLNSWRSVEGHLNPTIRTSHGTFSKTAMPSLDEFNGFVRTQQSLGISPCTGNQPG